MGVPGLHQFLKKKKVKFKHFLSIENFAAENTAGKIYIDFGSCFFQLLTSGSTATTIFKKIEALLNPLKSIIILVFDGPKRSKQKFDTSLARRKLVEVTLNNVLSSVEKLVPGRSLSRSKWQWVKKKVKASRMIIPEIMDNVKNLLIAGNFRIQTADMEADVYIARIPEVHVMSSDSDFFIHKNVKAVHKLNLWKKSIISIKRSDVMSKLALTSNQLVLYGMVNLNDYDSNVRGYGLVRNLKIIKKLVDDEVSKMLDKYIATFPGVSPNNFSGSLDIFNDLKEDEIDEPVAKEFSDLEDSNLNMKNLISNLMEQHKEATALLLKKTAISSVEIKKTFPLIWKGDKMKDKIRFIVVTNNQR